MTSTGTTGSEQCKEDQILEEVGHNRSSSYSGVKNVSLPNDVDRTLAENYLIARGAIFETNKIILSSNKEVLGVADFCVNGTYF